MEKDWVIGGIFVFFILFLIALWIYESNDSGFRDKQEKINEIYQFMGDRLTYRELKKRCPECTNVDYYRVKRKI